MSARHFPVADCDSCGETHTVREYIHQALTEHPKHIANPHAGEWIATRAEDLALIGRCLFGQLYATVADLTNAQINATETAGAQFITATRLEHQPGYDIDWNGGTFDRTQIATDLANARLENADADWRVLHVTDVTNAITLTAKAAA